MKKLTLLFAILLVCSACNNSGQSSGLLVSNEEELTVAIASAQPGAVIVMANGEWNDIQIKFSAMGTESKPQQCTMRAPVSRARS